MAIVTTKSIADPKPVRPIDWTGHPLREGAQYAGGDERYQDGTPRGVEASPTRPDPAPVSPQRKRRRRRGIMSPEQRQAFGDRMREYWSKKRGAVPVITSDNTSNVKSNIVESEGLTHDAP
jgi:hypothetical protein